MAGIRLWRDGATRTLLLLALAAPAAGCAADGRGYDYYIGYVRVARPADAPDGPQTREVTTLGAWAEGGDAVSASVGVGWRRLSTTSVPAVCQVTFRIRDPKDIERLAPLLTGLGVGKEGACYVRDLSSR